MKRIDEEIKKKIVKQHLQDGRTIASLSAEYGVSAAISNWLKSYREECQTDDQAKSDYNLMLELRELRKKNEELEKENRFLKKAAAFFAKEID